MRFVRNYSTRKPREKGIKIMNHATYGLRGNIKITIHVEEHMERNLAVEISCKSKMLS